MKGQGREIEKENKYEDYINKYNRENKKTEISKYNIKIEDFKKYNNYNLIREISKGLQRYYFIWRRRLLKYIFRR